MIHKISKSNELTLSEINKFLEEFRKLPIEVNLEDEMKAKTKIDEMCKMLLANLVIEDYKIL